MSGVLEQVDWDIGLVAKSESSPIDTLQVLRDEALYRLRSFAAEYADKICQVLGIDGEQLELLVSQLHSLRPEYFLEHNWTHVAALNFGIHPPSMLTPETPHLHGTIVEAGMYKLVHSRKEKVLAATRWSLDDALDPVKLKLLRTSLPVSRQRQIQHRLLINLLQNAVCKQVSVLHDTSQEERDAWLMDTANRRIVRRKASELKTKLRLDRCEMW